MHTALNVNPVVMMLHLPGNNVTYMIILVCCSAYMCYYIMKMLQEKENKFEE